MDIEEKPRILFSNFIAAFPFFTLSGTYLITWIYPYAFGKKMVAHLVLIMLLEFINIHSIGFMGNALISDMPSGKKAKAIIGLSIFYTIFIIGFSAAFSAWWPIPVFLGLTLSHIIDIFVGNIPEGKEKDVVRCSWAAGTLFYLAFVFATILLPIPRLGITRDVVHAQEFTSSGLWISEPYRVIAFGFLYFAGMAFSQLYNHTWLMKGVRHNTNPFDGKQ